MTKQTLFLPSDFSQIFPKTLVLFLLFTDVGPTFCTFGLADLFRHYFFHCFRHYFFHRFAIKYLLLCYLSTSTCTAHEISIIILLTVPAGLKQEFVVELQQMTRTVVIQVAHCKEWAENSMTE
jgi:hypothetical protein